MSKNIYKAIIFSILFASCSSPQSKINDVSKLIEDAEAKIDLLEKSDIDFISLKIKELNQDLEMNRNKYNEEDIKEIGKLEGRYTSLLVTKQVNGFKSSVKDLGNKIEGFIEGVTDTSTIVK